MSKCVAAVSALKVTGAVGLGLLTGAHLNFSLDTLQTILQLGSAAQAQRAFVIALSLLRRLARPLEIISTASLLAAYFFSPARGRHPYLLLAAGTVGLSVGVEFTKLTRVEYGVREVETEGVRAEEEGSVEVNGEVVRGGLEDWRRWGVMRAGMLGVGAVMSVVGLYGDRYHN